MASLASGVKPNPYAKALAGPSTASSKSASKKAAGAKPKPASSVAKKAAKEPEDPAAAALRKEVLAMGGDEAELKMLLEVDSEAEDDEPAPAAEKKGKGKKVKSEETVDPALSKELKSFFKSLDFASVSASAPDLVDAEDVDVESETDSGTESGSEESNSSDEESEEEVAAPASAPVKAEAPAKETKFEREQRRIKEREAEKIEADAEKAKTKEARSTVKLPFVKSPWVVDPTPQWYAVPLPTLAPAPVRPLPAVVESLFTKGTTLLQKENDVYSSSLSPQQSSSSAPPPPNGLSKSDQVFIQQILASGTSADKVSALLLLVSSSPLHTMTYLEQLGSLAKKKSREESGRAVRGLVDWWRGEGGGAPTRKLRSFGDQPGLDAVAKALDRKGPETGVSRQEADRCLVIWAFEDWLKKWFFEVLKALESMSVDPLPHPRTLAVVHLSNLLRDKPEQEGNILRLLVNKLGDSQRNIASKTSHHLLQILQFHPGMTPILVREVSSLILRPALGGGGVGSSSTSHVRFDSAPSKKAVGPAAPRDSGQDHARYYGVITLNQVMLNKTQSDVAGKMIDVYFQIFGDILGRVKDDEEEGAVEKVAGEKRKRGGALEGAKKGKKGKEGEDKEPGEVSETDSKLVAAVLTGVNRAFPFAKIDDDAFKKRLDILFRITHTGTFNVSIQALMLIFHVSAAKRAVSDRFYRALYASLFDPRLQGSSKQALYLNLVLKAMKQDPSASRVTAHVKRLVQVMLGMDVTFILGSIWIVGEMLNTVPGLRKILTEPESDSRSAANALAAPIAADTSAAPHPNDNGPYDGRKREPQFANAQNSCLWELVPLINHFHPSVALAAERLLNGEPVEESTDLEQHSLNHFLDRFVYREAKKVASTKGASMMQSGVSGQDKSGRIIMRKGRGEEAVVNSEDFKKKNVDDVPADQLFFHTYFSGKTALSDGKSKAASKRKTKKSRAGDESSDEESIGDLGFSDNEDEAMPDIDIDVDDEADAGSEDDEAEAEVWKAMKESMPVEEGDSDLGNPDEDEDDDEDLAEFDYTDSEEEGPANKPFKSPFGKEQDEFSDDDDNALIEDEDDLIGSDEDMPMWAAGEDSGGEDEEEGAPAAKKAKTGKKLTKKEERKAKKQKLKHLPMFGTAEQFAHLLGDSDDDGDDE